MAVQAAESAGAQPLGQAALGACEALKTSRTGVPEGVNGPDQATGRQRPCSFWKSGKMLQNIKRKNDLKYC